MTGGDVKEGKEGKERPALPVAGYEPPGWAGKAAPGLHLDVLKVLELTVTPSERTVCYEPATVLSECLCKPGGKTDPEADD